MKYSILLFFLLFCISIKTDAQTVIEIEYSDSAKRNPPNHTLNTKPKNEIKIIISFKDDTIAFNKYKDEYLMLFFPKQDSLKVDSVDSANLLVRYTIPSSLLQKKLSVNFMYAEDTTFFQLFCMCNDDDDDPNIFFTAIRKKYIMTESKLTECLPALPSYPTSLQLQYDPCCNCLTEKKAIFLHSTYYKYDTLITDTKKVKIDDTTKLIKNLPSKSVLKIQHDSLTIISYMLKRKGVKTSHFLHTEEANPRKMFARYNYPISFRVINLNPYKYDVSIDKFEEDIIDTTIAYGMYRSLLAILRSGSSSDMNSHDAGEVTDTVVYSILMEALGVIKDYEVAKITSGDCIEATNLGTEHAEFVSALENIISDKTGIPGGYKGAFQSLEENFAKRNKEQIAKALYDFDKFYNMSFTFVYNVPHVKNKDELVFNLNIKPKGDIKQGIFLKDEQIRLPIRGGLKIDGSVGLFWSNLSDASYIQSTDSVPSGSSYVVGTRIHQTNKTNFSGEFGALALAHFYWKWGSRINVGASFGAGLTFNTKTQVRGFAGLSALVGRNHRFCLTGGVVFGSTEKFVPYVNYGSFVPSNQIVTYKSVAFGYFFSITYNLPIPNRQVVKSDPPNEGDKVKDDDKNKTNEINNTVTVGKTN